uniref:Uncharacterized protein n=1 Tax=Ciona savignyi TaxID=51511 RepID=H2YWA1_CIOSA
MAQNVQITKYALTFRSYHCNMFVSKQFFTHTMSRFLLQILQSVFATSETLNIYTKCELTHCLSNAYTHVCITTSLNR